MKKICLIGISMIIMLSMIITNVYASTTTISFDGEESVEPGTTNKVTVKITSDELIGGITGKIETTNITNVTAEGKNGWSLTYNQEEGDFNAYKAAGTKDDEILEITYTAKNSEDSAKIELTNVVITNIEYEEEEKEDVSHIITVAEKETEEPQENGNTDNKDDTSSKEETQKETTVVKKTDTTSSKSGLPKTGTLEIVIPIVATIILLVVSYLGYRRYRGIKG